MIVFIDEEKIGEIKTKISKNDKNEKEKIHI